MNDLENFENQVRFNQVVKVVLSVFNSCVNVFFRQRDVDNVIRQIIDLSQELVFIKVCRFVCLVDKVYFRNR